MTCSLLSPVSLRVQDVSGSMHGPRINASLEGLELMFREVFQPTDLLSVVTYNGSICNLHMPMQVAKVDQERDKQGILDAMKKDGGYDKAYDALGGVIRSLQSMVRDPKYRAVCNDAVYQVLLVSDGGDNASTEFTLQTLSALVAAPGIPNFHLVVVAVQMSAHDAAKMQALCAPMHCTFLQVGDLASLRRTLARVGQSVQQRLVVQTTVTTYSSGRGSIGHPAGDLAAMQALTCGFMGMHLPPQCPAPKSKKLLTLMPPSPHFPKSKKATPMCSWHLQGNCRFGAKCKNRHG